MVVAGAIAFTASCGNWENFRDYSIYNRYDKERAKTEYVLKRPDGFTCTINDGGLDVHISQRSTIKDITNHFSLESKAYAGAGATTALVAISVINANRRANEHQERLDALTPEQLSLIATECYTVLKDYLASKVK